MDWNEIKSSVSEIYARIKATPCDCGGRFILQSQALGFSTSLQRMVDVVKTTCEKCGKKELFVSAVQYLQEMVLDVSPDQPRPNCEEAGRNR